MWIYYSSLAVCIKFHWMNISPLSWWWKAMIFTPSPMMLYLISTRGMDSVLISFNTFSCCFAIVKSIDLYISRQHFRLLHEISLMQAGMSLGRFGNAKKNNSMILSVLIRNCMGRVRISGFDGRLLHKISVCLSRESGPLLSNPSHTSVTAWSISFLDQV